MKKALIIIDTQDSFYETSYWSDSDFPEFKLQLRTLVDAFTNKGLPIVKVLHSRDDVVDTPFNPNSGLVKPMAFLPDTYNKVFYKSVHNAFTDTGLAMWLKRHKVEAVVITGIRTEQCCETTARIAHDLGFNVEFVTDATLTFEMICPITHRTFSPAELKDRTSLVLNGRFAKICCVKDYF